MMLVDANVWLALALSKHVHHTAAQTWLAAQSGPSEILFCRAAQQAFLRLLTTAAVAKPYGLLPLTNEEAWKLVEQFFADSRIGMAPEPAGLEGYWKALAVRKTSSPKLWMDAYLASFAIAAGFQLVTTDQGFTQFAGLNLFLLAP
jgi:toxin-antitoxin system PIN domain toxin